MIYCCFQQR